ncbi:MAG: double zinc ribbon domain-containing protein, partial [Acidobacteriota bacterium]|nr:double zinc ribbon domain-containing protein [Acidobacteriota bacterium]
MRALDAILAVVWAPRCAACDDPLDAPTRGVVCGACWRRLPAIAAPVCDRCGVPVAMGGTRAGGGGGGGGGGRGAAPPPPGRGGGG